jgi:hypothetical protein
MTFFRFGPPHGVVPWIGLIAHAAAFPCALAEPVAPLDAIIDNVRQNEALYENLEVLMHEAYDIGNRKPPKSSGTWKLITARDVDVRYVSQNGLFRIEVRGGNVHADGTTVSADATRLFDGQTTRLYAQGVRGNIIAGRADDDNFVRPHMLLLYRMKFMVPLSTYLQGHGAMARHPSESWNPRLVLENTYQGTADFRGLRCHKVWITTSLKDAELPHDRWELWLAEEKNYIPARMLGYTFRWSKQIPISVGTVEEWREIGPGIWFPLRATVTAFAPLPLQREGRQKLQWRAAYTVQEASLDPGYDLAFFRDLEFPDGTAMYEIEDGEIVRSYRVGAPEGPGAPPASKAIWRWWALYLNLVALAAATAGLLLWRRSRRKARSGT